MSKQFVRYRNYHLWLVKDDDGEYRADICNTSGALIRSTRETPVFASRGPAIEEAKRWIDKHIDETIEAICEKGRGT